MTEEEMDLQIIAEVSNTLKELKYLDKETIIQDFAVYPSLHAETHPIVGNITYESIYVNLNRFGIIPMYDLGVEIPTRNYFNYNLTQFLNSIGSVNYEELFEKLMWNVECRLLVGKKSIRISNELAKLRAEIESGIREYLTVALNAWLPYCFEGYKKRDEFRKAYYESKKPKGTG